MVYRARAHQHPYVPRVSRLLTFCVFAALAVAVAAAAQTPAPPVPVPPIKTSLGTMPGVSELPARPEMPDIMTFENGKQVTTAAQWKQRREEMKRILSYYATGLMPPPPGNVRGRDLTSADVLGGAVKYRLVHLSFGPGSSYGFDIALFVPAGAKSRIPTIVFPTFGPTPGGTPLPTMARPPEQGKGLDALTIPMGDQTARAEAAGAPAPVPPAGTAPSAALRPGADPDSVAKAYAQVFERGYALAIYHYQDTGEDTIGRNLDGSWAFRSTRYYPAYPSYDWGLATGWAWGISRVIDYVETQPFVDRRKLIAIGHSRLGKAVLVAGAFEDRLAVVAPAGSGAGGTGAYRFNGARGGGREGLADEVRKYPNWFSPNLRQFATDVDRLPFDQHWLIALAAPRAFVSLEGTDDQNCVVNATRQAILGARPAYDLLGVRERLGVNLRPAPPRAHGRGLDGALGLLGPAVAREEGRAAVRRVPRRAAIARLAVPATARATRHGRTRSGHSRRALKRPCFRGSAVPGPTARRVQTTM